MKAKTKEMFRAVFKAFTLLGAVLMFSATIMGAMAASFDASDEFTLKRGESLDASFVIFDDGGSGSVSTTSPFITLSGKKSLAFSELDDFEDALVVDYEVTVGENVEVGRYVETIEVIDMGEESNFVVQINVQRDIFVDISRIEIFGHTRINVALVTLIFFVLLTGIFSIILNRQLRGTRRD